MDATVSDAATGLLPAADLMIAELEAAGVLDAFGVISLHNMPFLDAIRRRGAMRFTAARGEAGACNMADAAARVSGRPALLVTSTGTGAGNAAGALVEALTAGSPVIHITGQVDSAWLDRGWGFIHEAKDQLGMLRAVSKAAWRIARPEDAVPVLREAVRAACTPPSGPVSIEIAIDIQRALVPSGTPLGPLPLAVPLPHRALLARAAEWLSAALRPVLWVGGGALEAAAEVTALADAGIPVVASSAGRGVLDEDHEASLAAFAMSPPVAALLEEADLLIVAGSHLRSNETRTYTMKLPRRLVRIDADPASDGRGYPSALFLLADAAAALRELVPAAGGKRPEWRARARAARAEAEAALRRQVGRYEALIDAIAAVLPKDAVWVRDITLSNSIWGNRLPRRHAPRTALHAMGGGIGQGLAHGVGAALAAPGRQVVAICGDGGFMLNPGELATARQSGARVALVLMNDGGYGVIRNIQDAEYGGRRGDTDLLNPDFAQFCASLDVPHRRIAAPAEAGPALEWAASRDGIAVVEVDMAAYGPFAAGYAGPPRRG
jgi:acetolactate synthase-1/2/3 large subunit